jgi:hypothetical protein
MTDLVTLAAAQAFVQDTTSDGAAWVQTCIDAASQSVIDFLGPDPSTQTRTELLSGYNTSSLYPRASGKVAPITGLTSITINPALTQCAEPWPNVGLNIAAPITVDMSTVSFEAGMIYYTNGRIFPRGKKNITVVYTSGYALTPTTGIPNLPSSISLAVLYTVKAFYTTLGKEMNAASESYSGVMSQSFFSSGAGAIPPAAQLLLKPYLPKMHMPG